MTDPRSLVANAASAKQVKRATRREKQIEARRLIDLNSVMAAPAGRRFMWWLLGEAGINESVLRGGPDMALFYAGKQDFGHMLYARVIKNEPDNYLLMQKEAVDALKLDAQEAPPVSDRTVPDETEEEEEAE